LSKLNMDTTPCFLRAGGKKRKNKGPWGSHSLKLNWNLIKFMTFDVTKGHLNNTWSQNQDVPLLKKPSQQIIIARQSKESLYCEMPFTSIACSLDVLHASGGDTLTKVTISHQNMSLNMHAYMERMYNYYNYSRTLCIECWVSSFHTEI
jgi:hypothetical protein